MSEVPLYHAVRRVLGGGGRGCDERGTPAIAQPLEKAGAPNFHRILVHLVTYDSERPDHRKVNSVAVGLS